jgi:hypothetical protein
MYHLQFSLQAASPEAFGYSYIGYLGLFPWRVKLSGREADHSPPSSAEVKNAWICTSTPQFAFVVWCSVKESTGTTLPYLFIGSLSARSLNGGEFIDRLSDLAFQDGLRSMELLSYWFCAYKTHDFNCIYGLFKTSGLLYCTVYWHVKGKGLIKHHPMKAYWGVEV